MLRIRSNSWRIRRIEQAASQLRAQGATVSALEVDLATREGVDRLYEMTAGRQVDELMANAGHGLGGAFLDQDFDEIEHVIDTNITGTFLAVYNGTTVCSLFFQPLTISPSPRIIAS